MKTSLEFHGFCDDAGAFSLDGGRDVFLHDVAAHFKGYEVTLTVTKRERSITTQQRKWLRGPFLNQVVKHLIEYSGYRPDEIDRDTLHYDFLMVRYGTKTVPTLNGGVSIVPARRSRDLSSREVAEYIDWLAIYCAEHMHLVLELPDEWKRRMARELAVSA